MSEKTKGAGSFKGIEKAINLLNEKSLPYNLSVTVMEYNWEHLCGQDFIKYFEDRGVAGVLYVLFMPLDGEYKGRMPNREQIKKFTIKLAEQKDKSRMLLQSYTNLTNTNACRAGTHHFYINTDGEVSPCFAISYSLGNISDKTLEDIITSPFAHDFRKLREETPKKCAAMAAPHRIIKLAEHHKLQPTSNTIVNYAKINQKLCDKGYILL